MHIKTHCIILCSIYRDIAAKHTGLKEFTIYLGKENSDKLIVKWLELVV